MTKLSPALNRALDAAQTANQQLLVRGGGKIASDSFLHSVRSGTVTMQDLREAHSQWQSALVQAMDGCPQAIQMGQPERLTPTEQEQWTKLASAEHMAREVLVSSAEHMEQQPYWPTMRSTIESLMPELAVLVAQDRGESSPGAVSAP